MDYKEGDYAEEFGLPLHGRLWQIYSGTADIPEADRQTYLRLWREMAKRKGDDNCKGNCNCKE